MRTDSGFLKIEENVPRLVEMDDLAGAAEQLTKALAEQPSSPVILRNRGQVYVRLGNWKEAADDFLRQLFGTNLPT